METKHHRALLIDDDPTILEAYRSVLACKGSLKSSNLHNLAQSLFGSEVPTSNCTEEEICFELTEACQGAEGLQRVQEAITREERFAVAIIDMRMPPGLNGMETAQRLLQIDPEIEIVFITAYSDIPAEQVRAKLGHKDIDFLYKPVDSDQLLQVTSERAARRPQLL